MLWDDQNLYVGFWMEDRDVWGTEEEASPLVRQDNNAGVLLVGQGAYYELAVNPLGATSEMFYIWKEAYQRGGRYDVPEFDLACIGPKSWVGDRIPTIAPCAGLFHTGAFPACRSACRSRAP